MKRSSRKSKKGSRSGRNTTSQGPTPSATSYAGPLILRGPVAAEQLCLRRFTYTSAATTSGSGILSGSYTSNPSGSSDWSDATAMYQEFRTLGYRVTYHPQYLNYCIASAPVQQAPIGFGINRGVVTAPVTYGAILQLENGQIRNTTERWHIDVRSSGPNEMAWFNTPASTITSVVSIFSIGLDNSKTYGLFTIEWLVQLRSPN